MPPRNDTIDRAKGIGILLMIAGHAGVYYLVRHAIYSFHMPLFFLLSGYLYRPQAVRPLVAKLGRSLIRPYLLSGVVLAAVAGLLADHATFVDQCRGLFWATGTRFELPLFAHRPSVGPTWFLLALFWCRLGYTFIGRHCPSERTTALVSIIVGTGAYLLGRYAIGAPLAILVGGTAMIFYALGHLYRLHGAHPAVVGALLLCWAVGVRFSHMEMLLLEFHHFPLNVAAACGGTLATCWAARHISGATGSALTTLGRASLHILCAHSVVWLALRLAQQRGLTIPEFGGTPACLDCSATLLFVINLVCSIALGLALHRLADHLTAHGR